jgi:hypothetical protein
MMKSLIVRMVDVACASGNVIIGVNPNMTDSVRRILRILLLVLIENPPNIKK